MSTNQGCRALTPTRHLDPRYFYYYFLGAADVLDGFSAGSTFRELSTSTLAQFRIPLPSAEEQSQIAAFLDYETARIDRLIENQQRLIALLEEKRQAVISHAVTKGLDPDVPMKDSGVEWLGDIPSQWKPLRLKHVGNVVDCKHKTPEYVEDGYPLVSTTEVKPGVLDLSLVTRRVSREDYEDMSDGRQPERGDIVYSRNASLGAAAFVDTDHPFCMGQDVVLIKPERSDGEFLTYALNSHRVARQVEAASIGATFKRLNVEDIKRFWLAIPPHEEQRCIAQDLTYRLQRFIAIVRKARAATELLHEHRTALISATVTGKIDVRDWQPPQSANEAEERDERLLQAADERASYD